MNFERKLGHFADVTRGAQGTSVDVVDMMLMECLGLVAVQDVGKTRGVGKPKDAVPKKCKETTVR